MLKDTEANFKRESENLSMKINDVRMENNKYALELKKTATELATEKESMFSIKDQVNKQLEDLMIRNNLNNKDLLTNYNFLIEELKTIKRKLSDFKKKNNSDKTSGIKMAKVDAKKTASGLSLKGKHLVNAEEEVKINSHDYYKETITNNFHNKIKKNIESEVYDAKINNNSSSNYNKNTNLKSNEQEDKKTHKARSYLKDYISGNSSNRANKEFDGEVNNFSTDLNVKESLNMKSSFFKFSNSLSIDSTPTDTRGLLTPILLFSEKQKAFAEPRLILEEENEEEINEKNLIRTIEDESEENDYLSSSDNCETKNSIDISCININSNNKQNILCNLKVKSQTDKNLPLIIDRHASAQKNELASVEPRKKNRNASSVDYSPCNIAAITINRRLLDKTPTNNNDNYNNNKYTSSSYDWQFQKMEKEYMIRKEVIDDELENIVSNIDSCLNSPNFNSKDNHFIKEFAYVLSLFNENFFLFKRDFMKKLYNSEQRTIQLENYYKKKLEELSDQIKIHLPISFNAYIKGNYREMPVERSININNACGGISNVNVQNIILKNDILNGPYRLSPAFGEKFSTHANNNFGKNTNLKNNNKTSSNNNSNINNMPVEKKTVKNFYLKTSNNFPTFNNVNSKGESFWEK